MPAGHRNGHIMRILGIRFCKVSEQAGKVIEFLDNIGLTRMPLDDATPEEEIPEGAIFPAGDSWIEVWQAGESMPTGVMLQIMVDDADAFADHARENGLEPKGPVDAHGERIYFVMSPDGLQISFQSRIN